MMAGLRRWRTLQILILFSLLGLSGQFEMKEDLREKVEPDVAALHRLQRPPGQLFHSADTNRLNVDQSPMSLLRGFQESGNFTACVTKKEQSLLYFIFQDLDVLLALTEKQKTDDWLLTASEISHSYSQKLLIMTNKDKSASDRVHQEYFMDPRYSEIVSEECLYNESCVPEVGSSSVSGLSASSLANLMLKTSLEAAGVFSLDGNTTTEFQHNFMRVFMVRGLKAVLETNQENHQIYQVMGQPDSVSTYRVPQREVDPSTQYDHQQIIMLQDDEVVRKAASFLYEKHPAVSSVYVLDDKQKVKLIGGKSTPLSENSRLVLVGHGARDQSGEMRVSGFSYEDVSSIIQSTSRVGNKIRTTRVLACEVGSDQRFIESLLKTLRGAGIETELHLWNAVIQVTQTGHIISRDVSPDGPQWRLNDGSKKVVAALHRNGEMIRRHESGSRGEQVFTEETNFLKPPKKKGQAGPPAEDRSKLYRIMWPQEPERFISPDVYNKMDQNKFGDVEQIKKDFNEIEGLTWGMFHSDQQAPERVPINPNIENECVILDTNGNNINWLNGNQKLQILQNCYLIDSGARIRKIISHYGKDGENRPTYLMVNDWIFLVEQQHLYVYPVGKRLDQNEREGHMQEIMNLIESQNQEGKESYNSIRHEIRRQSDYPYYVTGIFTGERRRKPINEELFLTWYFTASVIAESARNFRTFPLTLMALDMSNNHDEGALQLLFDEHPMARGGSWINKNLRGFRGSAAPDESSSTPRNTQLEKLKDVLEKELKIFQEWKEKIKIQDSQVLNQMVTLIQTYNIFEDVTQFQEDYNNFKALTTTNVPSASGSLGGHDDNFVTMNYLENSRKRTRKSAKQGEDLAGLDLQDGAGNEDINPEAAEFRAELSPDNQQYNRNMTKNTVSVSNDVSNGERMQTIHRNGLIMVDSSSEDLNVRIQTKEEELKLHLLGYNNGDKHQHLQFQSSDGVLFKVTDGDVRLFQMEAFKVTLKQSQVDCRLDLSSQRNLSKVHTVQGCPSQSNDMSGNSEDNSLIGGWKDDALDGGGGDDTLIGGHGADILIGGTGDDTLYGEDGNDTLIGDSGRDVFIPGPGSDLVDGGPGRDTVLYRGDHETGKGVYVNLLSGQGRFADAEGDVLKDVETVVGTIYSDILVSGYESALLQGSDGNDILVSTGGDYLVGGEGNDVYMLAFHRGSATIDNCAKDKATDVLYLDLESSALFDCQLLSDRVLLTFTGANQTAVKVGLRGSTSDGGECGHLVLVFRDEEASVNGLLEECHVRVNDFWVRGGSERVDTCDGSIP
ncbi:uncharacterized protein LOC121649049 [Melanotaenia boesemani]|uniref:uncharacterized protein LOC121649049 n=1 Tax=Melanotaenia boesemani TaxID=1250792 RepID=UPI001C059426|nr:uncharacterized protein LOC121649049 [Melanotaenia boesemani]